MLTSEEFYSDFLGQIPAGLIVMVCGSFFLLFVAFAWFAYFKPLRRKRMAAQAEQGGDMPDAMPMSMPVATPSDSDMDTGDLPALDSLLDTTTLDKELPQVDEAAVPPPVRSKNSYRVRLNTGTMVEANELVAVLRDAETGRLIVQMNNTGYRTLANSPDAKQDFMTVMKELANIVNAPEEGVEAPAAAPPQHAPEPEPAPTTQAAPAQVESAPPPPTGPDGAMPGDLPSYDLDDAVKSAGSGGLFNRPKFEAAPTPELNIAEAIEAYLQHKLNHTPEYAGREIHVHSAPGGGVRIQVDNSFFEAVSDVNDPQIREFLSTTIQEWQDRQ